MASDAAGQAGEAATLQPGAGTSTAGGVGAGGSGDDDTGGEPQAAGGGGSAGSDSAAGDGGTSNAGRGGTGPVGAKAFSDFVESSEGWTITGDPVSTKPTYSVTGGHPDGMISCKDGGSGIWCFTAPAKFLGDVSKFAGGVVRFDLKVDAIDAPFYSADVLLTTMGLTLAYDLPNPTTSWKTYSVPLSAAGWHVDTVDGPAATPEQMATVLANLTRLRIRGEYNSGADIGYLDNVYLGAP